MLRAVKDPRSGQDIVAAGLIDSLEARGSSVHLALRTDRAQAPALEAVCREAEALLARQPGVTKAAVVLTMHRPDAAPKPAAPAGASTAKPLMPGVRHIVAVASGKGGVGKSTTAVNLAVALARAGHRVGLLDADVYGPSLPRMLGVSGKPELADGKLLPIRAWGLLAMSIGLLVDQDTAMIWRGPMVMSALEQMMGQVVWGELDVLIVDMPPGTGDAQLTMAQRVSLSGAVIVSTPQDIALIDARRGVRMFEKVLVPVLGLVENMSTFVCPHCGTATPLFGHGGARREAEALGVPFLGEVPLLLDIRTTSDEGTPITAQAPDSPAALAYAAIAARLWASLATPRAAGVRIIED
ncbi:MAG: Mrp/NBP35 family ATP-binding protein [Acetobacteraceae bacterium]